MGIHIIELILKGLGVGIAAGAVSALVMFGVVVGYALATGG